MVIQCQNKYYIRLTRFKLDNLAEGNIVYYLQSIVNSSRAIRVTILWGWRLKC